MNLRPRDIMDRKGFENAVAVDMAIGGSTNSCLHLPAIAKEAGVPLDLDTFSEFAKKIPHLTLLKPAGRFFTRDFYEAGGVPALMTESSPTGCCTATPRA